MPLSSPVAREPIHTRRIECRGYRRADGLWDIEGHLVDTKAYAFMNRHRGEVKAGEPVRWSDVAFDANQTAVKLRREMEQASASKLKAA